MIPNSFFLLATDIDLCVVNHPCLNGATCTSVGGIRFFCSCAPGFTGSNCETGAPICLAFFTSWFALPTDLQESNTMRSSMLGVFCNENSLRNYYSFVAQVSSMNSAEKCFQPGSLLDSPHVLLWREFKIFPPNKLFQGYILSTNTYMFSEFTWLTHYLANSDLKTQTWKLRLDHLCVSVCLPAICVHGRDGPLWVSTLSKRCNVHQQCQWWL